MPAQAGLTMHAVLRYTNGDRRIFQVPEEMRGNNGELPPHITIDDVTFVLLNTSRPGLPVYVEPDTNRF